MSASIQAASIKTAFLQNAATSVATISPSTAAYLGCELVQLQQAHGCQNKALTDHQRQTVCTACGNMFIPGWNCSIARGGKDPAQDGFKKVRRRTVVYHCQACYHHTSLCFPSPKRRDNKRQQKDIPRSTISDLALPQQTSLNPAIAPTKTSSKKRAQARKDKLGLQSLLKKSREENEASPQFTLMDFMMP